jgi:hypothetical protein
METTVKIDNHFPSQKKKAYISPQVEILEIKIEKGFAASPVGSGGSSASDWGWGSW